MWEKILAMSTQKMTPDGKLLDQGGIGATD
jgi:hypothetical protein